MMLAIAIVMNHIHEHILSWWSKIVSLNKISYLTINAIKLSNLYHSNTDL